MKRPVKIKLVKGTWFVSFVNRRKGQRYSAAQFDARHSTVDFVKDWISKQPTIELKP